MPQEKNFHPNNLHNKAYDFQTLIQHHEPLKKFVQPNKYGNLSIDFFNNEAVLVLNQALLKYFYKIEFWEIPEGYLCPPIPGRVDYIHYLSDILCAFLNLKKTDSSFIKGLDIGVGANGVYSLLANRAYNWQMVGSDIDKNAIHNMQNIIDKNSFSNISLRYQTNQKKIFESIIKKDEKFDFTLCNPPFHKSKKEALVGTKRKVQNLTKQKVKKVKLNFGGQSNELWCEGGELRFIKSMIEESKQHGKSVALFSTLVSKQEHIKPIEKLLKSMHVKYMNIVPMQQGQKITRFMVWSFLTKEEQQHWKK